jgi:hypothetical protein
MEDVKFTSPKKRWALRILGWTVGIVIVLLVVAYFVGTSSPFVKSFVLPRVSQALNAQITVSEASIHPFNEVVLRDLKVTPNGAETLLSAPEVRTHYSLFDIIRGSIKVEEITLRSPTIHLVENPDGSSNLDPLLKQTKTKTKSEHPEKPSKPSKPGQLQIDVGKLSLSNGTIRREKLYGGNRRDVLELSTLNLTLINLKNGDSGKLDLSASILLNNNPPSPGSNAVLQAVVNGNYVFALSSDLKPQSIKGQSQVSVSRAEGTVADLAALGVSLDCDVAPTEITQVALRFRKGKDPLGELRVNGPFDSEKMEGRLNIRLLSLDHRVLDLLGESSGMQFGTTAINSTNELLLANAGSSISVTGRVDAAKIQVIRANQKTPTLDFLADYSVVVDRAANNATLRALNLSGVQDGRPLLRGELGSPMSISWGTSSNAVGDSALNLIVTNLNLADWKPFLGDTIPAGTAQLKLNLLSQQGGKQLTLDLTSQLANITPVAGDKTLASAMINAHLSTQLGEARSVKGGVEFTNVVVNDPTGKIPATPLDAKLELDATVLNQALDLRQLQVALAPTARALNKFDALGQIDFSQPKAIKGNLKLAAESLDLTSYYDLVMSGKESAAATNAPPAPKKKKGKNAPAETKGGTPSTEPNEEPPAQHLPFEKFVVEANINRFYLRELEVTSLQTTLNLDGSHVLLKPFQLAINGAPVDAMIDLDLGVPGYKYALGFNADHVPFTPLVNTFAPERKGELGGTLTAHSQINGAGITGVNLQKNLTGQFDIGTTNLNLAISNVRSPLLRTIINVVAKIPEILHSPEGALGGLLGAITGSTSTNQGGLTDELSKSPIDVVAARGKAGDGRVDLEQATIRSSAFEATAQGNVLLAAILDDSRIEIPVTVSLSRSLADRINLTPANTPTNSDYAKLPDFLKMKGTVGKPKADVNKLALAGAVLKSVGGAIPGTNIKTDGLIQSVGGILGGRKTTNAPASSDSTTNAPPNPPAKNPLPVDNLLDKLLKPKGGK